MGSGKCQVSGILPEASIRFQLGSEWVLPWVVGLALGRGSCPGILTLSSKSYANEHKNSKYVN